MSETLSDILIFGAGFGTRMAPLTDTVPKPLIEVAGVPLIEHAARLAEDAGLNIHVNTHYKAAQMRQRLPRKITVHVEHPEILDTGGGLKAALPDMRGELVATLNSDAVWRGPNPLEVLRAAWQPKMTALLLLVPLGRTTGYTRDGNFLIGQDGTLARSSSGQIYTGAQLIRREAVLSHNKDIFSLNEIWNELLDQGDIHGVVYPGEWADVGTPEGIGLAEAMLAKPDV